MNHDGTSDTRTVNSSSWAGKGQEPALSTVPGASAVVPDAEAHTEQPASGALQKVSCQFGLLLVNAKSYARGC